MQKDHDEEKRKLEGQIFIQEMEKQELRKEIDVRKEELLKNKRTWLQEMASHTERYNLKLEKLNSRILEYDIAEI